MSLTCFGNWRAPLCLTLVWAACLPVAPSTGEAQHARPEMSLEARKSVAVWIEAETAARAKGLAVDKGKSYVTSGGKALGIHTNVGKISSRWGFVVKDTIEGAKLLIRFAISGQPVTFRVKLDDRALGCIKLPNTGGWGYRTGEWELGVVDMAANMPPGSHSLVFENLDSPPGVNVDWLAIVPESGELPAHLELPLVDGKETRVVVPTKSKKDAPKAEPTERQVKAAKMLVTYHEAMTAPKPFTVRTGQDFKRHQQQLREEVLKNVGLWPLPERIDLDAHESKTLDHPWCTVRRVYYQLWPGVYSKGLLYVPKALTEKPAPAVLCPHGHWRDGNAHPDVQTRCLTLAKMGYVVFSPVQLHHEDLNIGISHQTVMIWNNMRALDYLDSLAHVDRTRIGCAGASGGGLQTQMLVALDDRVKAASIVGITCDFREIAFAHAMHCGCNHFPRELWYTDWPEISALGLPAAVQYLTMNDWTRHFERDNFAAVRGLYAANGLAERTDCKYWPTPHTYDRPKRERTYWWMEKWLRGDDLPQSGTEPDNVETFEPAELTALSAAVPKNKGLSAIGARYREERGFIAPAMETRDDWLSYRDRMRGALADILGEQATLPRGASVPKPLSIEDEGNLVVERIEIPSEGPISIPTVVLRQKDTQGLMPVVVICTDAGKNELLEERGTGSATHFAERGSLVVLPDVRFSGELSLTPMFGEVAVTMMAPDHAHPLGSGSRGKDYIVRAWSRNSIVWGRPVPGMTCTDVRSVLDHIASRQDADMTRVKAIGHNSASLALGVLFAAAIDDRIASLDVDLRGFCFRQRGLPAVPFVLQHGDVLQWASLLADRRLTIRNVPRAAGDPAWLSAVFAVLGNGQGLTRR